MADLSPEKLAKETERLRNDQPFAEAMTTLFHDAQKAIADAEAAAVAAMLAGEGMEAAKSAVIQARANKHAIEQFSTVLAHQILRGTPREIKPVA